MKEKSDGIIKGYIPGERTVTNFLKTAFAPMGSTLYVYGGGWNYSDTGSSDIARTIGASPTWKRFFDSVDASYDFKGETYPRNGVNTYYYAGLDCSGYVGWVVYNTLYSESETYDGFVCPSTRMAKLLSEKGLGGWRHMSGYGRSEVAAELKPGDIVSISGHVYILLGSCSDKSLIILHSTVTDSVTGAKGGGVQLSALSPKGENGMGCRAYELAREYMQKRFPKWTERYPVVIKDAETYLDFSDAEAGVFTWSDDVLRDEDNIRNSTAEQILKKLF